MSTSIHRLATRRAAIILTVVAAVVLMIVANTPSTAPAGRPSFAQLDSWLDDQVRDAGIPGAAAVIVEDGQVVHTHAVGVADDAGRPVTSSTPFVIGSLSKSFTALAVAQLAESGRIDLDAPVVRYLPEFRVADPAAGPRITVRQLLIQTSGLPGSAGAAPLSTPATSLTARVRDLSTVQLAGEPGATFRYSNANYLVLGRLIEVVSGQSYGDYLAAHVFEPLAMHDSWTDPASAKTDGLTRAHRLWFGLSDSHDALFRTDLVPAGFIATSAEDLGHMLVAQLDGGRFAGASIASAATIAELQQGVAPNGIDDQRYAMGWEDGTFAGQRLVSHAGSTTDMASYMALVPGRGLGVAVLFNGQSTMYELLHKPDSIGLALTAQLMGVPPQGTLTLFYPAFDILVALVLVSMARGTFLAARRTTVRPWGPRRVAMIGFRGYLDIVVPIAIVLRAPEVFSAGWDVLLRLDIGLVIAAIALIRATDGLVRVGGWVRRRRAAIRAVDAELAPPAGAVVG